MKRRRGKKRKKDSDVGSAVHGVDGTATSHGTDGRTRHRPVGVAVKCSCERECLPASWAINLTRLASSVCLVRRRVLALDTDKGNERHLRLGIEAGVRSR